MKLKGYLLAALAAATYGTNPAFAIPLYADGMNANSVLLFRYILGLPLLLIMLASRGRNLKVQKHQIAPMAILGILMALSSFTLFESYNNLNAGVASTLLFVYPILVAVLMIMFFHEKFSIRTVICLILMCGGLVLLTKTDAGFTINGFGFMLVMLSALTYAIYLVMVQVSPTVKSIPTLTLTFYVLMFGSLVFWIIMACGTPLTMPEHWYNWGNLLALAILPTVISLMCTSAAIQRIGSTPTAIFGALEPLTAVVLSIVILGQSISVNEIFGGILIILATTIVIAGDNIQGVLLRMRRMFPSLRRKPIISVRSATPDDAPIIGWAVAEAIGSELCSKIGGSQQHCEHMFARLAAMSTSQYSYNNARIAVDQHGTPMGVSVSYNGELLDKLREPAAKMFMDEVNFDLTDMGRETEAGELYIDTVAVLPGCRGAGIGSVLLHDAINRAHSMNLPAGLLVDKDNDRARRLYQSIGFMDDGERCFAATPMFHMIK